MDLIAVAIELYRETPARFTAARNARAREATAADRALADQIRRLPKTSASVWALNQLATEPRVAAQFTELGTQLRRAQDQADRSRLEQLLKQRKALVARTIGSAEEFARTSAVKLSGSARSEIEQSLHAALADEDGAAAVFSGRLVRPIRSDGLDPVDLAGAVAGPALKLSARRHSPGSAVSPRKATPTSSSKRALAARRKKVADEADALVARLQHEQKELDTSQRSLEHDIEALQAQFDSIENRRSTLDARSKNLAGDMRSALDASRKAHAAVDAAGPP